MREERMVAESVYLAAVQGRADFRKALVEARKEIEELRECVNVRNAELAERCAAARLTPAEREQLVGLLALVDGAWDAGDPQSNGWWLVPSEIMGALRDAAANCRPLLARLAGEVDRGE